MANSQKGTATEPTRTYGDLKYGDHIATTIRSRTGDDLAIFKVIHTAPYTVQPGRDGVALLLRPAGYETAEPCLRHYRADASAPVATDEQIQAASDAVHRKSLAEGLRKLADLFAAATTPLDSYGGDISMMIDCASTDDVRALGAVLDIEPIVRDYAPNTLSVVWKFGERLAGEVRCTWSARLPKAEPEPTNEPAAVEPPAVEPAPVDSSAELGVGYGHSRIPDDEVTGAPLPAGVDGIAINGRAAAEVTA